MDLGLQITVLLFAAMLGLVLARRIGQSATLGMILLGVVIGPTALGLVQYNDTVQVLAEMGAIFMLFTIGLECNYREIYNLKNSMVAFFGVIVPFAAGYALATMAGYPTLQGLFIGTALTATSIAITARVLKERGMLATPVAKTIIGAAVVDDVLGLVALGIITSIAGSASLNAVILRIIAALLFVAGCILLIRPMNALMRRIDGWAVKQELHQLTLFSAMVIAFGYAGIAAAIGMSSVVGAFLAGVTLEAFKIKGYREGAVYFELLFSAIFFVSLGVLADLRSLNGGWAFAALLIIVAILSKYVGCLLPARAAGHTWKEASMIGMGMVPRGEVAFIVGLVGLTSHVITPQTYGIILLMGFMTTILTPLFLSWSA